MPEVTETSVNDKGLTTGEGGGGWFGVTKLKVGDQGPLAPLSLARARHQ